MCAPDTALLLLTSCCWGLRVLKTQGTLDLTPRRADRVQWTHPALGWGEVWDGDSQKVKNTRTGSSRTFSTLRDSEISVTCQPEVTEQALQRVRAF